MKKILIMLVMFCGLITLNGCSCNKNDLPKPERADTLNGIQFHVDKNINMSTIDNYLFRSDVVYRDMRMLKDDAEYENIDGDSYLSGFIKGFEVVPYPYLAPVEVPEEVGTPYQGRTLFSLDNENKYIANYEESMDMLEYLFPKDKIIFLMCGGGGYAGNTREMLISLGWDENKLYNIGGYWGYTGSNDVKVKRTVDGVDKYDFYKVSYHDIDFDVLTPIE